MPALTATDMFAGAGGASEGLSQAGIDPIVCINHDPIAIEMHKANHGSAFHATAAVQDIDWRQMPASDVLWASPSCVWHAPSGGRKAPPMGAELVRGDAGSLDRATAFSVLAAAEVHRYPILLIENVPEFTRWVLYPWWLDGLRQLGYQIQANVFDAADFGHAQHRKRLFLVAALDGIEVDLTPPEMDPVYAADILDDDPGHKVTRRLYVSDQIDSIPDRNRRYLVTYRRNAKALPADSHRLATITAAGNHHGMAWIDDDGQAWHRMLNNRECARGQGFGDDYVFLGTKAQQKRAIGNAVPVGIARWLGERSAQALSA